MKKLTVLIVALLLTGIQVYAQDNIELNTSILDEDTSELTVIVKGLSSDEGSIIIGIYSSEDTWLSKNKYGKVAPIVDGVATVVFDNIPMGIYGISTFQDKNENYKLDTGLFGIPKEPYAASRGAIGRFGPPKWVDAQFVISNPTHEEVIMY